MNTITCPYCHKPFELDKVLTHQIEEGVLLEQQKKHDEEMRNVKKQLEEARQAELEIRKQKNALDDEKRTFELEKQRQLDKERNTIRENAAEEQIEKDKYKFAELEKKITDTTKALEEANRKVTQGSQQLQGEVLELDLEKDLREAFIYDEIIEVGKGSQGADIVHKVKGQTGRIAGTILWETKDAKWSPSWLAKLREDGRKVDAMVIVLVAKNLPSNVKSFKFVDGVLITSVIEAIPLAGVLRRSVLQTAVARQTAATKDEKLQSLHAYLQSEAFRHRFEAFSEGIVSMSQDLDTERRSMERVWKRREVQIERLKVNAARMYGELQGVMDNALPEIKTFSLPTGSEKQDDA